MGGCASKPKELDGPSAAAPVENSAAEPEVTVKHVDVDAPQEEEEEEVKAETPAENNKSKEAPLVDLSSPKAEAGKIPVGELASEIGELKADIEPVKVEPVVVKEEDVPPPAPASASAPAPAPVEQMVAPVVIEEKQKEVAAEKVEEVKEPALVVDEKKVSA